MKICKTKMDKMERIKKTKVSNTVVLSAPNTDRFYHCCFKDIIPTCLIFQSL